MAKKYYITTPLYYVNAKPHIGHAYTNILCDTFARFHRFLGEDVFFMTGTDEHGSKIEKTAREGGKEPKAYVDEMVPHFRSLWEKLGINHDYFIRTTDEAHKFVVHRILKDLEDKGEIYKANYEGWYSIKSETFYSESELIDGKCPDTGGEVQKLKEENYFFKMSKYQNWLIETIEKNPDFIQPKMRRNEILGFLRQPLQDLSITRPIERLKWGIPYPDSKDHVIYVWFEALINYISGIAYTVDSEKFNSCWPADLQVVGKDILRHHGVYWPIMLKACGIDLPKTILAHGWWTLSGAKVSKSSGNIVDPIQLIEKYGVDALRYFLLNEVTLGNDGAFSEDLLAERYRTDLANDLGNLFSRSLAMLVKYFEGVIPKKPSDLSSDSLIQDTYSLYDKFCSSLRAHNPRQALSELCLVIRKANQYVDEKQPWALAKDEDKRKELEKTLFVLTDVLAHIACLLQVLLPQTADKMLNGLGLASPVQIKDVDQFTQPLIQSDVTLNRPEILFPRLEEVKDV